MTGDCDNYQVCANLVSFVALCVLRFGWPSTPCSSPFAATTGEVEYQLSQSGVARTALAATGLRRTTADVQRHMALMSRGKTHQPLPKATTWKTTPSRGRRQRPTQNTLPPPFLAGCLRWSRHWREGSVHPAAYKRKLAAPTRVPTWWQMGSAWYGCTSCVCRAMLYVCWQVSGCTNSEDAFPSAY